MARSTSRQRSAVCWSIVHLDRLRRPVRDRRAAAGPDLRGSFSVGGANDNRFGGRPRGNGWPSRPPVHPRRREAGRALEGTPRRSSTWRPPPARRARMATVFFTGFPGFLGSELLPRVLKRQAERVSATCLVQPKFRAAGAGPAPTSSARRTPGCAGRIAPRRRRHHPPRPGPGRGRRAQGSETVEIFHLAAVYDLAVRREVAMRVNVDGTRHVLDFAQRCPHLGAAALREHLLRLRALRRRLPRERPGQGPGVQQLLRGDQVPGRGRGAAADARGPAGHDLPAGDRRRRQPRPAPTQKYDGPYYVIQLAAAAAAAGACCRWPATRAAPGSTWCRATSSSTPSRT